MRMSSTPKGLVLLLVLSVASCAPSVQRSQIPAFAQATQIPMSGIRYQQLTEAATEVGAQGGLAYRATQINHILLHDQAKLDRVFNFNRLLLKENVLPPVLVEGRDSLNQANSDTLRLADRSYKILMPPRFATTPPTWREYLLMNFKQPDRPDNSLLPRNRQERAVWNKAISTGWQQGIRQANEIYASNLARLKRDINGMVLYRKLRAQNMVSEPFVAKTDLGITGDANTMRLNDKILKITAKPALNLNSKTWNPAIYRRNQAVLEPPILGRTFK